MLKHLKLAECDSTQEELKRHHNAYDLVSTTKQTQGRGRGERSWEHWEGALAFSFRAPPHPQLTWQALEVAVSMAESLEGLFGERIGLKWPNDLYRNDLKCGGILLQNSPTEMLIGVGLNLLPNPQGSWGSVLDLARTFPTDWAHDWPLQFVRHYLNTHPRPANMIKASWLARCVHFERKVTVTEGEEVIQGIFRGLGPYGEALIGNRAVFNGTLRWD